VTGSYLRPATVLSHLSPREKQIRYEIEEKGKISGFPSAKEIRQAKEAAAARLRREAEEAEGIGMVSKQAFCPISWRILKFSIMT
jgi:DNA-directed RNA polymerase III subunit RPC3